MTSFRDLRFRVLAAFMAIACIAPLHRLPVAAFALAAALLLALAARLEGRLWRRLAHTEAFLILLFVTLPFTVAGQPLLTVGPLTATVEGSARAALIACKITTAALILMTLLGDAEPARLGAAFRALRVPEPITRLFVMTVRYVSLIRDEAERLRDAMRSRGFRPASTRHSWKSYGNLIGMLLVRALDRANRIEEAMRCRGYDGRFPHRDVPAPRAADWAGLAAAASFGVLVVAMDRL